MTTDHQVALEVGENTIKVKVTAEDDATTETYTVVVTRQAQTADVTLISNLGSRARAQVILPMTRLRRSPLGATAAAIP